MGVLTAALAAIALLAAAPAAASDDARSVREPASALHDGAGVAVPLVAPVPRAADALQVAWEAPVGAAEGWEIRYRRRSAGEWTYLARGPEVRATTLHGLAADAIYEVQARLRGGAWSTAAEGWTHPAERAVHPLDAVVPPGAVPGARFRLLHVTETAVAATSAVAGPYHAVAGRVASGTAPGRRALVSTPGVDARVNTDTTYDDEARGVPIYWADGPGGGVGAKVADDYADFYDGSWQAAPQFGGARVEPWTGSAPDGAELLVDGASAAMGAEQVGHAGRGKGGALDGGIAEATQSRPLWALSPVYRVAHGGPEPAGAAIRVEPEAVAGMTATPEGAPQRLRGQFPAPERVHSLPPPSASERDADSDRVAGPMVRELGFGRSFAAQGMEVPDAGGLSWRPTDGGGMTATFAVASPGAAAVRGRLVFEALPPGAEVRAYAPRAGGEVAYVPLNAVREALAANGPGSLWTPTVRGETLGIELYLAPGGKPEDLRVSLPVVSHFDQHPADAGHIGRSRCSNHVDVACRTDAVSAAARLSTAKYIVTNSLGRSTGCTGVLLNDLDASTQVPYFITAEHCLRGRNSYSHHGSKPGSMELYWFFERAACSGAAPVRVVRTTGATVLVADTFYGGTRTDVVLLRLLSPPPPGAVFAGWSTETVPPGEQLVMVHHPALDLKKVGRVEVTGYFDWDGGYGGAGITARPRPGYGHLRATVREPFEKGSSGSGAWRRIGDHDYLVGTLSGGSVYSCNDGGWAGFGRFDQTYPVVKRFLGTAQLGERSAAPGSPVVRLVLVDGRSGAEVADLTAGSPEIDVRYAGTQSFNVRAEVAGTVDGMLLVLDGPVAARFTSRAAPHMLFGEDGGGGLAPGRYTLSATAYHEDGAAWPAVTGSFTVSGQVGATAVDAVVLAHAQTGEALATLADGDAITVRDARGTGRFTLRARTAGGPAPESVRFEVTGPANTSHTAVLAPFEAPVRLPPGVYRVAATPTANGAAADPLVIDEVEVRHAESPVRSLHLVDAAADARVLEVTDGAVADISELGALNFEALVDRGAFGSVQLELDGPLSATVTESRAPVTLFGENGANYRGERLPNGVYTLTAQPYSGVQRRGSRLPGRSATFTLVGGPEAQASPVEGFTLLRADANGTVANEPLRDGARLDLAASAGRIDVRADIAAERNDVVRVEFSLAGPREVRGSASSAPHALFGEDDDSRLPNGTYTLTAVPYAAGGARGRQWPPRSVTFTVTGSFDLATPELSSFTLVDAAGAAPDPDVSEIAEGAVVRIAGLGGGLNVRADATAPMARSVRFALNGPVPAEHTDDGPPFALFGDDGAGDYVAGHLREGAYTLTATPYLDPGGRGPQLAASTLSFTLEGSAEAASPVTGFWVVDARDEGLNADLRQVSDGDALDIGQWSRQVSIRAAVAATEGVGSVRFQLEGAQTAARVESGPGPYALAGRGRDGDYRPAGLPNGAYTLTATPYPEAGGAGAPGASRSVTFTVTGSYAADSSPVTGLTAVAAAGGTPDPDIGPLEDGTTIDLDAVGGELGVRATVRRQAGVRSVRFVLDGPVRVARTEDEGGPYSLFGDDGRGDHYGVALHSGAYTLTATPYTKRGAAGTAGVARSVSFTVLNGPEGSPVTGFTQVDAAGAAPDPDIGLLADGAVVEAGTGDWFSVRADVGSDEDVGSVRFRLEGPVSVERGENRGGPYTLFGDQGGDYFGRALASGAYRLTATPRSRSRNGRIAWPDHQVRFTVAGGYDAGLLPLGGFVLVDARGGPPDADMAAVVDGGTLDVSPAGGDVNIRVEVARAAGVAEVRLALAGPVEVRRSGPPGEQVSLFGGDGSGGYAGGYLPDGDYTLTATAHDGRGGLLQTVTAAFTVSGTPPPSPGAFTLIDAGAAGAARFRGPLADRAFVDLSDLAGGANVRLDRPSWPPAASVRFTLAGERFETRVGNGVPYSLFGTQAGEFLGGELPHGRYTLTARAYAGPDASGLLLETTRARFTVGDWSSLPVASLSSSSPSVAEGSPARFEVSLSRPAPPGGLAVGVSVTGTGDFLSGSAPSSVAVPAGASSATLAVATEDDRVVEGDGAVAAALVAGSGYALGSPSSATVSVADGDAASWTAAFTPAEVAEGGSSTLTASAGNVTFAAGQRLTLAASGTATAADHGLPASLTLPAGSSEATAAVAVADDDLAEGAESLSVEVSHGGAVVALASLSIPASDPPAVSVSAPAGSVPEGAAAAFEVSLDRAAPAGGLSVGFEVSDPDGRLAEAPPAAVAFAAGEASARVALATADDAVVSGDGSLAAALVAGDGYTLGGSARATVTVSEDDAASWTLAVEPGAVEEGGRAALTASIGNGVAYAEDLEVSFSVAGLEAGEYALEPAAAVLAAGSSSVTAVLELLADEQAEAPGTAALAASAGGSELASATLAVVDAGAAPRVEGVPQVGAVLAAVVDGLADGEAVGYRWLRGDPDGERVPVAGATAARHALTAADVGERLSVEVARLGRTRASGATAPTWPAPANAPVGADEQELLSAELTVRSWRGRVEFAGYSRRADVAGWPASAGALSRPSLALGGAHEVDLVALRVDDDGGGDAWGLLGTTPALADGSDLTVHWNGHRIGPLSRSRSASLDWLWRGSATHGGAGVRRHFGGAADGVRVALSIRRPLPVATLTAAEKSVAEGSAAAFEVVLDRPAASATAVSVSVSGTAGALDGAPPASVTVAAGASRATLPVATADDAVVRGGGSVTATLAAGAGYRPGAESTATVTVSENDAATWSVSASPSEIAEGGSATLTVSVANGVTFAADREIALSASGTASASDYALPAALALAAGASSATASLRAVPDGEAPEAAETVAVAASHGGASIGAATVTIAAHERNPSSDASLSSLALSGADIGPFDPAVTAYSATVGRDVASTRVEATPADANASVEIADASGSTAGPSRTVALSHGDNAVDATVTAEDAATARTYAVTVTREPPLSWGDRLPARDLALGPGSAPGGLWSDGEVLWVSDWWRPALSAHALADGGRVPERDVGIGSVRMPAGLHGASGTLRVVDHHGGAFGHSIADGARRPSADLSAESLESAGVPSPTGIWSDGAAAWVAGLGSARLAAFSASDGSRLASRDLELAGMVDALRPWGLWSDGEVLLAASHGSGAVRAYALSDGSRRPGRDVDTGAAGQPQPTGIWSDGAALWVADASAGTVQAYAVPGLSGAGASGPPPDPFAVRASSRAERVPAGASAGPAAAVADPALRSRIAAALGKGPGEPLGAAELASLRSLDARGAGVASLDGLQAAVNLEALDLGLNPVADLRPLASLPRLRSLNLDGAPADPWPLASLPALERLSLRGAGLADAAPLAGLARLRSLDLAGSAVADVSALGGLARLSALRLDGSPVADLSPLASLPELRRLSLRGVAADPAPLAGLRLESLVLDGGAPHGAPPAP